MKHDPITPVAAQKPRGSTGPTSLSRRQLLLGLTGAGAAALVGRRALFPPVSERPDRQDDRRLSRSASEDLFKLTNIDIVSHLDGRKFHAHGVRILDLSTDPTTTRVEIGGFAASGADPAR